MNKKLVLIIIIVVAIEFSGYGILTFLTSVMLGDNSTSKFSIPEDSHTRFVDIHAAAPSTRVLTVLLHC